MFAYTMILHFVIISIQVRLKFILHELINAQNAGKLIKSIYQFNEKNEIRYGTNNRKRGET